MEGGAKLCQENAKRSEKPDCEKLYRQRPSSSTDKLLRGRKGWKGTYSVKDTSNNRSVVSRDVP